MLAQQKTLASSFKTKKEQLSQSLVQREVEAKQLKEEVEAKT